MLREWSICGPQADTALLIGSELVTNAVEAAREMPGPGLAEVVLRLSRRPGAVLVEVGDPAPGVPLARGPEAPGAEHGRGLLIVAALAAGSGSYAAAEDPWWAGWHPAVRKVVWATVATS